MSNRSLICMLCLYILGILPGYAQIPNPFERAEYAQSPHPLSARSVGFRIRAELDVTGHMISGEEDIYLLNTSTRPLSEIPFHLYMNAFSSNRTRMGRRIQRLRRMLQAPMGPETVGYCRILELSANFNDLTAHLAFDETVATVPLPFQVQPGESVLVHIRFQTRLPKLVIRSGYANRFHMLGQWFPKPGVLQRDGSWRCPPYGSNGEFVSEFGIYDVTLTVPAGYDIAASGRLLSTETTNGRKTCHFYAEDVHDFAAAVWDRFRKRTRKEGDVTLTVWYPPGHERVSEREMDALVRTYRWYIQHIGPYPYPVYHLVDVPFHALAAGGMEYPMLGTGFALKLFPEWYRLPEETVVHEFGHSYFQGMVASNEYQEAWLDEGINTYVTGVIMDTLYGPCSFNALQQFCANGLDRLLRADHFWLKYVMPGMSSNEFPNRQAYSEAAYTKTALLLKTLESRIGRNAIMDILQQYVRRFAFRHPDGNDFLALVNDRTNHEFDPMLDRTIHTPSFPDAAVIEVTTDPLPPFKGYSMKEQRYLEEPEGRPAQLHRIVLGKHDLPIPVPYRILLTNGRIITGELAMTETVTTVEIPAPKGVDVSQVDIDPQRQIALDLDRSNNHWVAHPSNLPRVGTCAALLSFMELVSYVY